MGCEDTAVFGETGTSRDTRGKDVLRCLVSQCFAFRLFRGTCPVSALGQDSQSPKPWTVTGPPACRRTPRVEGFLLAQAAGAEAPSHEIDRTTTSIWRYNLEAWMPSGFGFDVFVWRRCKTWRKALPDQQIRANLDRIACFCCALLRTAMPLNLG